jgi:hypothetical protein
MTEHAQERRSVVIIDLDKKKLGEIFEKSLDTNLLYEEFDDQDHHNHDADGDHVHHNADADVIPIEDLAS